MDKSLNIDSYCRVCMDPNPTEQISLFQMHESEDDVIANMIIDCTEVLVSDDDNLPQYICRACLIRLTQAYKLRKQCQRSDQTFKDMLLKEEQSLKIFSVTHESTCNLFLASFNAEHIQVIDTEQNYKCVKITGLRCCGCNYIIGNNDEFQKHLHMQHVQPENQSKKKNECILCGSEACNKIKIFQQNRELENLYYVCIYCEQMWNNEDELVKHLKDSHDIDIILSSKERHSNSFNNEEIIDLKEEYIDDEQDVEYLDDDEDYHEHVDSTFKKNEILNENSSDKTKRLLAIVPQSEFVSRTDEFSQYRMYHISGERCCGCYKLFVDTESLLNHCYRIHKNHQDLSEVKYQCDSCFQIFENSSLLTKHKLAVKSKIMYLCKICDLVLEDETRFLKHIIFTAKHDMVIEAIRIEDKYKEISINSLRCCGCDKNCANEIEFENHIKEFHQSNRFEDSGEFKCNQCFKGFDQMKQLERHKSNALKKMYRCSTDGCNFSTENKRQMLKHITKQYAHRNLYRNMLKYRKATDFVNKNFCCCFARCTEVFDSYEELEDHAVSAHEILRIQHTQDRKFFQVICTICLKGFENQQTYERHRSTDRNRKHKCLKCGAQYVSKSTLIQHERSKCGKVAQYQCTQCDKTFVSLGGLRNHQGVHSQNRSHICDICGRGFLRKGILKDHINTVHSKERLFQCSLCPKSFNSRNVFNSHQMTHTKEKPYQCRHCDKRYYKTSDRTMHENQVHFGIRPFRCNFCSASFIRDRERRLHERTHTKTKLYSCDTCSEGFNKFADYKSHRFKEHGLETLRDLGPTTMAAVCGRQKQTISSIPRCKLEIEIFDVLK